MVGERADFDIVIEVDWQRSGVTLRGVLLAADREFFGHRAEVGVEDAVQALLPGRGELAVFLVARLDDRIGISLDYGVDFVELRFLVAVVQAGINLLGDDAVAAYAVDDVMRLAADGEVQAAVQADVLDCLFEVDVAYDPHLREV